MEEERETVRQKWGHLSAKKIRGRGMSKKAENAGRRTEK